MSRAKNETFAKVVDLKFHLQSLRNGHKVELRICPQRYEQQFLHRASVQYERVWCNLQNIPHGRLARFTVLLAPACNTSRCKCRQLLKSPSLAKIH